MNKKIAKDGKKVCAFIFATGKFHNLLAQNAVKSFKHYHADIPIFVIDDESLGGFDISFFKQDNYNMPVALLKVATAYEFMKKSGFKKLICLGADTITCGRLTEFLEDDKSDVIATACYPYQLTSADNSKISILCDNKNNSLASITRSIVCYFDKKTKQIYVTNNNVHSINKEKYAILDYYLANPEVVCYNNIEVLKYQIDNYYKFHFSYAEFGSLNAALSEFSYKFADLKPNYVTSTVVYNSRAKESQQNPLTNTFKVIGDKLFTRDNKHIKVYHFQEQFTLGIDKYDFDKTIEKYKTIMNERLNEETKQFFKNQLDIDIIEIG